jgi:hypothetical protein
MRSSSSSRVSTMLLYTSLFIQHHEEGGGNPNWVRSGDLRGQLKYCHDRSTDQGKCH